ncbi:MAG: metallophosphoesterase [Clostridia bacterium]|nr:metallophosphoesterase [Clostridia bacterium]
MSRKRFLIASDIHLCHIDWYGVPTAERMERFVRHVKEEYERDPFEALLLLGDYSLDHWKWDIQGCFLTEGRSCTKEFADGYISQLFDLGIPMAMIAGNHEQYGYKKWNDITGYDRKDFILSDDILFILLDTFGADLDPAEHSDGTFIPADMEYIKMLMNMYPDKKVILCAHHFDPEKETEEFKTLVREDKRVLCLLGGHVHKSDVIDLGEKWGNKALLYTGNYSYCGIKDASPTASMWGFRDLIIDGNTLESRYITPENDIVFEGESIHHPYGCQDEYKKDMR